MSYDEMELDMIGDQRTAMFVIISDTDDTFNFVVAIMYTQLFNLLCDKADDEHGGRLADYDKKNAFDVEKYLEHRLVLPKDAEFELYECNVTEEEIKSMESLTENYD